jgi:uncharacterized integral membrane protein
MPEKISHEEARYVLQDMMNTGKIMDKTHDLECYLSPGMVLPAMENYAEEQVRKALTRKQTTAVSKSEIQWSYGSVGAVVGLFMWLIFTFVVQPGKWMFADMSAGQAMLAFGVLTIVAAFTGALIGVLLALQLWVDDRLTKKVSR